MKLISFELTMPNRGSWNGKWSGEDKRYFIVKSTSDKAFKNKEHFKELEEKGFDNFYYRWNDGWGANVRAEIIDSKTASKRRKQSAGFCGYDWMVDSILMDGIIIAPSDRKEQSLKIV